MPPLVIGTLAIDEIEWPHGHARESFGGSASFSAIAASIFGPVRLIAGVGEDFPPAFGQLLSQRGVDLAGVVNYPGQKMFRWHGRYHDDLNRRDTIAMQLNLLANYEPVVPPAFTDSRPVLIANMPPAKQLRVLEQLPAARFVLCDTIDDWIIAHRDELIQVLGRVDVMLMNDAEVKLLAGVDNLYRAGRQVLAHGPKMLIVKKGDHGAVLFDAVGVTVLPAFPTENVVDPTGAGDSFAGGILGYLGAQSDFTSKAMRRAICYGTVAASFTVEGHGLDHLKTVTRPDLDARFEQYRRMLHVE
jgi:sugar/nucleoside kinase (ribokinase family)